jgi:hypothetical protein
MSKYKVFSKMWFLALLLVAVVAGCASNGGDPGTFVSLKLTPSSAVVPVTGTVQYTALAVFDDGSSRDVTAATAFTAGTTGVTWDSIKGHAIGAIANATPVVITAKYDGNFATANLTVNDATPKELKLTPASTSIPRTGNQQYTLLQIFSDGSSQPVTTSADTQWSTLNNSGNVDLVLSGANAGLATGVKATSANSPVIIRAIYNGVIATAELTVNSATSVDLKLTPVSASIPRTGNQQYSVLEIFSDGTSTPRTSAAAWSISNNAGNIDFVLSGVNVGLATGVKATSANSPVIIDVTYNGMKRTANLTVNDATSKGLKLTPLLATIPVNGNQQYTLLEIFSDGSSTPRTGDADWGTENNAASSVIIVTTGATVGRATGYKATAIGSPVRITAKFNGVTVKADLNVTDKTVMSIMVTPISGAIPVNGTKQFKAFAVLSDGSAPLDVTEDTGTSWTPTNVPLSGLTVASLSANGVGAGLAKGLAVGESDITATYNGLTSPPARLTVNAKKLLSIVVLPKLTTVPLAGTQQFTAVATYDDGSVSDETKNINTKWSAIDVAPGVGVATVSSTGLATGNALGKSTIKAVYEVGVLPYKSGTATLTVTPSALVPLGLASTFGTFGGTAGMTNTGILSLIGGDIGTIATATDSVTGFHDTAGDIYTQTPANIGPVTGKIYTCTNSTTGPTSTGVNAAACELATQARLDAETAYLALAAMPTTADPGENLAGLTLTKGVYKAASGKFLITGSDLTLTGTANDLFVFQMATSLEVGASGAPRSIILAGNVQAKNVFWQVGSAATINPGGGGTMVGTIISQAGVAFSTVGSVNILTLNGRALSLGASVTLVDTVINVPAP